MVILLDDEDRENEGDLIGAAEHVTPAMINFMLTKGRGMMFVAVDGETADRLKLSPQVAVNTTQRGTAYTVSVDAVARFGITTGVSALRTRNDHSPTRRPECDRRRLRSPRAHSSDPARAMAGCWFAPVTPRG